MMTAHELTALEMRRLFLNHLRGLVAYCAAQDMPCDKKLDILVFSILNIFDGTSGGLPAFALVPSPHPDDEADAKENDEDWWPTGVDIAEAPDHLHAMWATKTVQ